MVFDAIFQAKWGSETLATDIYTVFLLWLALSQQESVPIDGKHVLALDHRPFIRLRR